MTNGVSAGETEFNIYLVLGIYFFLSVSVFALYGNQGINP